MLGFFLSPQCKSGFQSCFSPDRGGQGVLGSAGLGWRTPHYPAGLAGWEQQGELKTYLFFNIVTCWKVVCSDFLKNSPVVPAMEISFLSSVFGCCAREGEL